MSDVADLKDCTRFKFSNGRWTREVLRRGSGPTVTIIHELPSIHPLVLRFADRVAAGSEFARRTLRRL